MRKATIHIELRRDDGKSVMHTIEAAETTGRVTVTAADGSQSEAPALNADEAHGLMARAIAETLSPALIREWIEECAAL